MSDHAPTDSARIPLRRADRDGTRPRVGAVWRFGTNRRVGAPVRQGRAFHIATVGHPADDLPLRRRPCGRRGEGGGRVVRGGGAGGRRVGAVAGAAAVSAVPLHAARRCAAGRARVGATSGGRAGLPRDQLHALRQRRGVARRRSGSGVVGAGGGGGRRGRRGALPVHRRRAHGRGVVRGNATARAGRAAGAAEAGSGSALQRYAAQSGGLHRAPLTSPLHSLRDRITYQWRLVGYEIGSALYFFRAKARGGLWRLSQFSSTSPCLPQFSSS